MNNSQENSRLSLNLLGTFQVELEGEPVRTFRSDKVRALLAFLVLEADRPHRREALAAMFWTDSDAAAAKVNLRQTLSRLKRALKERGKDRGARTPALEATRQTLRFNSSKVSSDVLSFTHTLQEVERHPHSDLLTCPECVARLESAAALYRGDLLHGFSLRDSEPFEEWLLVEREAFRQQALELMHELAAVFEQQGDFAKTQVYARRQLAVEPWREAAHRQLIRALARQGERSAALAQFETCRTLLAEELGVEPTAATTALVARIRSNEGVAGAPSEVLTHNLPVQLTPFVGRESELTELAVRLTDPSYRLLSLLGPGGIGKTRLALETAQGQLTRFSDGVFFVPLVGVGSAEALPTAVAQALGIALNVPQASLREQVLTALETKETLLVLDNFEHLMGGVEWVLELLQRAPKVVLLVTSRERLNVQGEDLYRLRGLPVPTSDDPAEASGSASVRLFLDRARRLDKGFRLDADTLPEVARICRAVEGLPLAIELAVTWIRDMSLREIAVATENNLDFLATDLRDVAPRQRSLRTVFEHSWALLTEQEQAVFARLSVFRGGFSARAAAEVAGATPLSLTRLRYKTLVRGSRSGRYSLHELLRQFAEERLMLQQEQMSLRTGHSNYYLNALVEYDATLQGRAPKEAVLELQPDLDNLRRAWDWAVEQGYLSSLERSVSAFEQMYTLMGLDAEGEKVFSNAARRFENLAGDDAKRFRARTLMELCRCQRVQGKLELSLETAQEAVRLAQGVGESYVEAKAYLAWGHSSLQLEGPEAASTLLEAGLARARAGGHAVVEAELLINIGFVHNSKGNLSAFENCLQQALVILRRVGNRSLEQAALLYLSLCQFQQGDYGASRGTIGQALELSAQTGNTFYEASIFDLFGRIEQALGRFEHALPLHERSLQLSREIGYRGQENHALHHLCAAYRKLGRLDQAEAWGQEALSVAEALALPEPLSWTHLHLGYVFLEQGRGLEAQDAFTRARDGWQTLRDEALELQAKAGLVEALLARGESAQALEVAAPAAVFLSEHGPAGTDEPSRIYLALYRALSAHRDARASALLKQACEVVEARAAQITDPTLRRSYLENIPGNGVLRELRIRTTPS